MNMLIAFNGTPSIPITEGEKRTRAFKEKPDRLKATLLRAV